MYAENSVLDQSSQSEVVEDISAVSPHTGRGVLPSAFVVESIYLGDLSGLMVASNQCHSIRVSDFQGKEKQKCFDRVVSSVDKVSQEEVVLVRTVTALLEQLKKVIKLSMNVATDLVTPNLQ